ncbi:malate dehydrogenase (quinone) [Luteolibacter pohnpeiensis]|uniref:Probable malate:quinone oxidoreductase n=1 Tax=Luteolibacter pohnpeiensis TaxID=454153 RepID=A0A934S915_9BACT|nr:malate dehydrogenase (quinone) [Luteolibacter pohnpeiensis]
MSSNLAALLKRLQPDLTLQIYEVTDELAQESSHGWNNAGTGHAGLCELSYTPKREADGSVNVAKVIEIFEQFEQSKLFWSYAVRSGMVAEPKEFINPVQHLSFVHGQEQVDFLKARHAGMSAHHFFSEMEYSTDRETIGSWAPLLMEERPAGPVAATRVAGGTDVNFGAISRKLLHWISQQDGCAIATGHRVTDLRQLADGWEVTVENLATRAITKTHTKFVFVGAGGGSLPLLQKSGIKEAKGLGGFPIGGQWLVCDNPEIVAKHQAKVYGQALDAAPTMAVPHLDTRILDGKKTLLFGPFAAWTTKFLHKKGSALDLPRSVKPDNIATLIKIGIHNLDLVKYLVQQGTQSMADRMEVLHVFYPGAEEKDWKLIDGGIRVQAIKKTDGEAGIVHYGTEVITDSTRTISALLGASPGASVSVHIVLEVIKNCFPHLIKSEEGKARMKEMIPTWDVDIKLPANAEFYREHSQRANEALNLISL